MSKGSGRRPAAVEPEVVDANWERTFGARPAKTNGVTKPEMRTLSFEWVPVRGSDGFVHTVPASAIESAIGPTWTGGRDYHEK